MSSAKYIGAKDMELQPLVIEPPPDRTKASGESEGPCQCCLKQDRSTWMKICCGCCCCQLVTIVIFVMIVIHKCTFEVYGTTFTFSNYIRPNARYLAMGMANNHSLTRWYKSMASEDNPLIGLPFPNTQMFYGWQDVKHILSDFGPRIRKGTMKRYNELGITIQNSKMWPLVGTIALGLPNPEHAIVRPWLGKSLDGARGRANEDCDGSTCWNSKWLHRVFRKQFASQSSFSNADLKWMCTKVFHKVHLNLDISDAYAQEFGTWMTFFLIPQPIPPDLIAWWPVEWVIGAMGVLETKAKFMYVIKEAITAKWPNEDWKGKLDLMASAIMDSLALAGGLSVPTVLDYMIALLFMKDSPVDMSVADIADTSKLHDFMLETMRRFPPVAGVPRWITDDDGETWQHQIPNVAQALWDPAIFPKPLEMVIGRPGLNSEDSSLSIGWADFALVNGNVSDGDSHACPGKHLSIQLMAAFLKEFAAAGPWVVESDDITLTNYQTTGWTVKKQGTSVAPEEPETQSESDEKPPRASTPPGVRLCQALPWICNKPLDVA